MTPPVGRFGVWSPQLRYADPTAITAAAAELEDLGFGTLWIPGGVGGDVFDAAARLLASTRRVCVATGIVNVWRHPVSETAAAVDHLRSFDDRFLLGLGVSHDIVIDADDPGRYQRPLGVMRTYLDALDVARPPVVPSERVLAALGPKMLELAGTRAAGAHPYLAPPSHTQFARAILGPTPLLAPEQGVLLERDPERARHRARQYLSMYLDTLPNYTRNLLRSGFDETDLQHGGSDRLVDALVVWGGPDEIAAKLAEHLDAGADHVAVQVLGHDYGHLPIDEWRALAAALR